MLLSDLVEERDGYDEEMTAKRGREAQRVQNLLCAGEEVRELAMRARGGVAARGVPVEVADTQDVVCDSVSGANEGRRKRKREDASASAMRRSKTDVYEALIGIEERKMEKEAEEKRAEREFRVSQTETLARIASALDPQKALDAQKAMMEQANAHQLAMQNAMMEFMKSVLDKK